jgi:hypothetical protein
MISFHEFMQRRWIEQNAAILLMGNGGVPNLTPREAGCFFGSYFGDFFGDYFGTV